MSMLDILKKNLTPEQFAAVQDALGDDFDDDVVPRSRLNKVIKQRNEARAEVERLKGSNPNNDDNDTDEGSGKGKGSEGGVDKRFQFTQDDIDKAVNTAKGVHDTEIANLHKRYAVLAKLQESKFVDPNLVLSAGLIDLSKITLDDNGVVTGGLDDQISSLVESKPYMVDSTGGGQRGTGKQGGTDGFGSVTSKEEFLKLPLDKQIEFKKANPEVFKGFLEN